MLSVIDPTSTSDRSWTIQDWFGIIGFFGGAIAVIFSLGVNWQKTLNVETRVSAMEQTIPQTYVRKDVEDERYLAVQGQLEIIRKMLDAELEYHKLK